MINYDISKKISRDIKNITLNYNSKETGMCFVKMGAGLKNTLLNFNFIFEHTFFFAISLVGKYYRDNIVDIDFHIDIIHNIVSDTDTECSSSSGV